MPNARSEECAGNVHIQPAMQPCIQQRRIISRCNLDLPDVLIQVQVLVGACREARKGRQPRRIPSTAVGVAFIKKAPAKRGRLPEELASHLALRNHRFLCQ